MQRLRAIPLLRLLICGLMFAGCGPSIESEPAPRVAVASPTQSGKPETVDRVRSMVAKLLQVPVDKVQPTTTLKDIGADELDLVELVMELEDTYGILIADEALVELAGGLEPLDMSKVSIERLAALVDRLRAGAPQLSAREPQPR
ncbi:acyl carrier protein [Planctellipticum variicoloris]|uniref:acyl carrier protein n=1 Tax=Planctellipticum variicoloris TaxID=3064265 RepID=UPI003013B842|nr:acyl carrier protein [Planctomycetaceae bacterium SH412]